MCRESACSEWKRVLTLMDSIRSEGVWPHCVPCFYLWKGKTTMHQALYRKWRPRTFSEVCGQAHITSILQYEVDNHSTTHAYLFCGSRGTGKTTCAKILAKAVNCLHPQNGNPCGECEACRSIEDGTATDVLEMDAASNTGVDYIRDIKEAVTYTPAMLKTRVYIVDEVHMLSASAFNALLKTLEEPPPQVIFILATTELQKIPATILSRCKRFDFRRISNAVIADRLSEIAAKEGISLTEDAAYAIAKLSQGGMRDAISLLELCAGSGQEITYETVNERAGAGGRDSVLQMLSAIAEKNYEKIFAQVELIYHSSKDIAVFWQELIGCYRDLLVLKHTKKPMDYLDVTQSELEALQALQPSFSTPTLLYHSKLLDETYQVLQRGTAPKRLTAEMALLRLCDVSLSATNDALLSRIEALEDQMLLGGAFSPQAAAPKTAAQPSPAYQELPATPTAKRPAPAATQSGTVIAPPPVKQEEKKQQPQKADTPELPIANWQELVAVIGRIDHGASSFLMKTNATFSEGAQRIYIYVSNSFEAKMIDKEEVRRALAEVLKKKGNCEWATADSFVFRVSAAKSAKPEETLAKEFRSDFS